MRGPFNDYKATEISNTKQKSFFVKPKYIDKLYSSNTCFIFGERGSGKTTILRYLEEDLNKREDNKYLAVYYRFETANMKSFYNAKLDEDENIENFSQIIHSIFCKLICRKLIEKKKKYSFSNEACICEEVCNLTFEGWQGEKNFEDLERRFEKIRLNTLFGIRNKTSKMLFDYNYIFEQFVQSLRKEEGFEEISFCFLLDEYENLTKFQQRVINSMVKASTDMVNYKICLRPQGFWTKNTLAEHEHLMEKDDYIKIEYTKDIMGDDTEIQGMMREVCYNRLAFYFSNSKIDYKEEDLKIDNYLEVQTIKEELSRINNLDEYKNQLIEEINEKIGGNKEEKIKQFTDIIDLQLISILLEKTIYFEDIYNEFVNKSKRYANWKHNYSMNALYIILDECGVKKSFASFDIILRLANYNIRMILLILNYAFEGYEWEKGYQKKIGVKAQDAAIKKVAKLSFNQIEYIPVHGYEVKNFIHALGKLFEQFLLDKQAKKFEVNNFTIYATGNICMEESIHISDVLKDAVIWGILLENDSNKVKRKEYTYDNKDYILHPIYAVYFNISYRTKQKCYIKDADIWKMLKPTSNTLISSTAKDIKSQFKDYKFNVNKDNIPGQIVMDIDKMNGVSI